jgi:hypothetical protein
MVMHNRNRREFLADVGRGMLVAGVGSALAADLGLAPAFAADAPTLSFGKLEPLVALMQETPIDKLLPLLYEKMQGGTELSTLVAAGALANARTFGGQDYDGYHTIMALAPAYEMARELPESRRALPVMKVLYRNTSFIHRNGGRKREVLHPVEAGSVPAGQLGAEALREAVRKRDMDRAEHIFAALMRGQTKDAFHDLQYIVHDDVNVHRVVLAWRAWVLLDLTGPEHAHTLLRQSVRFCVTEDNADANVQSVLPKLLDQYHLQGRQLGDRKPDDAWMDQLCRTIYGGNREQAADAAAAALAEGIAAEAVGEAISLAANLLVLRDPGRSKTQVSPGKPEGSVHGASVGVHASDSANAWRNIARVSDPQNIVASLIVGAYHTAGQSGRANREPMPWAEHLEKIKTKDADGLLREAEEAIRASDQARACALVQRYSETGQSARPVFDLLLKYAVSEEGALHAEKYYRTVTEEFATTRAAFRWRHLVALARVTASEYGQPAPGYAESCRLLKV